MKKQIEYDHVALIYNPISTGNAVMAAKELAKKIDHLDLCCKATLTPTKHAGHGKELSKSISLKYKRPLIISVSGDGGYNEIINGVMLAKSKKPTLKPVVAVEGAGNANDHQRVMTGNNSLVDLIVTHKPKPLDLLLADVTGDQNAFFRYAHSYIGLGITPEVALELNRHKLSSFNDVWLVIKTFMRYEHFTIEYKNVKREIDSLIFANIPEMAKILKLQDKSSVRDSKFEVIEFPHRNKFILLFMMSLAAIKGLKNQPQYSEYKFSTFNSHPMQLDGEVELMPKRADITIKIVPKAVESLY